MTAKPYHREASFGAGPRRPLTREDKARLRYLGRLHRLAKRLTPAWHDVLEALLSFVGPDGRCDPSVASIGERAGGLVNSTVHLALDALERLGLLRRFARIFRERWRTVQISSAYVLLPAGIPAVLSAPASRPASLRKSFKQGSSPAIGACGNAGRSAEHMAELAALMAAAGGPDLLEARRKANDARRMAEWTARHARPA